MGTVITGLAVGESVGAGGGGVTPVGASNADENHVFAGRPGDVGNPVALRFY